CRDRAIAVDALHDRIVLIAVVVRDVPRLGQAYDRQVAVSEALPRDPLTIGQARSPQAPQCEHAAPMCGGAAGELRRGVAIVRIRIARTDLTLREVYHARPRTFGRGRRLDKPA